MFKIQIFGDNDTVTAEDYITLGFLRADNTFQNYKLPNPKSDLTVESIQSAMNYMDGGGERVLLDSKTLEIISLTATENGTAYRTEKNIRTLDLSDTYTAVSPATIVNNSDVTNGEDS